jgi:hypothetical protein
MVTGTLVDGRRTLGSGELRARAAAIRLLVIVMCTRCVDTGGVHTLGTLADHGGGQVDMPMRVADPDDGAGFLEKLEGFLDAASVAVEFFFQELIARDDEPTFHHPVAIEQVVESPRQLDGMALGTVRLTAIFRLVRELLRSAASPQVSAPSGADVDGAPRLWLDLIIDSFSLSVMHLGSSYSAWCRSRLRS